MNVTLYTQPQCGPCRATKHALEIRGVPFTAVNVMENAASLEKLKGLDYLTVPVVIVEDGSEIEHWGGFQMDRIADLAGRLRMQEDEA